MIALLAKDVADVPPHLLERAVSEWPRQNKFMPKAAELIDLARSFLPKRDKGKKPDLPALAARYNASCTRPDLEWAVEYDDLVLRPKWQSPSRLGRDIASTDAEIVAYAKAQQASKRSAA